jgi:hypothetical protein
MEPWEHRHNHRRFEDASKRVSAAVKRLRVEVGEPRRRPLDTLIVRPTEDTGSGRMIQVYLPGIRVAGQGRCLCEALVEALDAYEMLLESAIESRDLGVLPSPDRSIGTWVETLKTEFYFRALRFLNRRIPLNEAGDASFLKAGFLAAVS